VAFQLKGEEGKYALARWLSWAARCRIPEFTELGKKIRKHLPSVHATPGHGLSNGLIESVNTKIRVITRMALGFHNPAALIALAMLALGGLRPAPPEDDQESAHGTGRRASKDPLPAQSR
jgi:transposase